MASMGLFQLAGLHSSWLAARQVTVASNVANVDTPGYRAVDVKPFTEVMAEFASKATQRSGATDASNNFLSDAERRFLAPEWGVKLSGNSVSVEQELLRGQEIRTAHSLNMSVTRAFHNMHLAATRG